MASSCESVVNAGKADAGRFTMGSTEAAADEAAIKRMDDLMVKEWGEEANE